LRSKVFEPFFTTKGQGKGTGLGLSMVYGFVKQSGGHITIESEVGRGTTIKMYFPRSADEATDAQPATAPTQYEGGNETVLIVEDDVAVRQYVNAQLTSLGYRTILAANAAEALALIDKNVAFDLLFTDIVMPGAMDGWKLASEAMKRRPGVKVLLTSGYSENAVLHRHRLDGTVLLLSKPYRRADLARFVRKACDGAAPPIAMAG
jgi:CheY-like chemotaxis protein